MANPMHKNGLQLLEPNCWRAFCLIFIKIWINNFLGTSIQPQFKNAKPYTPIDSSRLENLPKQLNATNPGPYGFSSATILYHGNIDVNDNKANPVIEIKSGLSGSQIQIRVSDSSCCFVKNKGFDWVLTDSTSIEFYYF